MTAQVAHEVDYQKLNPQQPTVAYPTGDKEYYPPQAQSGPYNPQPGTYNTQPGSYPQQHYNPQQQQYPAQSYPAAQAYPTQQGHSNY